MSDTVITVQNLSKRYRIGLKETMHHTLGSAVTDFVSRPIKNLARLRRLTEFGEDGRDPEGIIWALKDVSFEVGAGETVAIIGPNGAGKSTLLKILSRITEPTGGRVEIRGRVSSLLEVGTGFHPELTGRENVYLNGVVLGMTRKEVAVKFDEIVDFSGVERFIDTPLKRYSTGMQVRLAFSVAAHLDPEVLLVDEVLSVGDAEFQKKCLGKMGDVAREGRTVLFVSHNMAAVTNLCRTAIRLHSGEVVQIGEVSEVVGAYLRSVTGSTETNLNGRKDRKGDGRLRITRVSFADGEGNAVEHLQSGMDAQIILHYEASSEARLQNVLVAIAIDSLWGQRICVLQTDYVGPNLAELHSTGRIICSIPDLSLAAGVYRFNVFLSSNRQIVDWVDSAGTITVEAGDYYGSGKYPERQDGSILIRHTWESTVDKEEPCSLNR